MARRLLKNIEEEHFIDDASAIINATDEDLVKYFTYVVREERIHYPQRIGGNRVE